MKLSVLLLLTALPLSLVALPATDRKIEDAAKGSYNYRVVLNDTVKVKSIDGIVTLTGTVEDQEEKDLATSTASNLPGVKSVNNELTLRSFYKEHSDGWMAFKIRARLLVKGNVSATATTVSVNRGIVTLGGTADTMAQKELTGICAGEIDGVKSVQNDIVVGDQPATTATKFAEIIDDASITSQVKFALLNHKSTSTLTTKVTSNAGIVVITGIAGSDAEKALVTKLAQDVRGTKSVTNRMTIKS